MTTTVRNIMTKKLETIEDSASVQDAAKKMKDKSVSSLLNIVADLIDNNRIKSTLTDVLSPINAENLRKAHSKLESGTSIGKIVLSKLELKF